jgi:cystathionine beta-lyase
MERDFFMQFDRGIDRRNTYCEKWDFNQKRFGRADILPMWVADMDFASPDCVRDALVERAAHGAYGYTQLDGPMSEAVSDWMRRRHAVEVAHDSVLYSPGVVDSMLYALKAVTRPGDRVVVQPPVYGPFFRMTHKAGCEAVKNPLIQTRDGWRMDLDGLERLLMDGARAMLLCSPHNPVGRVWSARELQAVVDLCNRYGATLISDEIHADFALPGHRHTCAAALPGADGVILLVSASKTFNLAGLRASSIIVRDGALRDRLKAVMEEMGADTPNIFGAVAQTAAYRRGAAWLDALIRYLDENRAFAEGFLAERVPAIKPSPLEGTYLMWLDCRALGLAHEALVRFFIDRAGVGLSSGVFFGEEGAGFMRINLAAPKKLVEEGLTRIEEAVNAL